MENVMVKKLNIYEAQDIIREDLQQFDKTVSGLRSKAAANLLETEGTQGKPTLKNEDALNSPMQTRPSQPERNKLEPHFR
jgi:hypothetical protein